MEEIKKYNNKEELNNKECIQKKEIKREIKEDNENSNFKIIDFIYSIDNDDKTNGKYLQNIIIIKKKSIIIEENKFGKIQNSNSFFKYKNENKNNIANAQG